MQCRSAGDRHARRHSPGPASPRTGARLPAPRRVSPVAAGYSGTPLARKLGLKAAARVLLIAPPDDYLALLAPWPEGVVFETQAGPQVDVAQLFVTEREVLAQQLGALRRALRPDAALWVSWPKKASKRPTTVNEDTIRELALPLGFVDVKVCAVDAVWSGLKLMVRQALREPVAPTH